MDDAISNYDSSISKRKLISAVEYPESLYFERKGVMPENIKASKLANELIGMLNADGGVLALGVADNGALQDLEALDSRVVNQYRKICQDFIKPSPKIHIEEINIDGNLIFLYHVRENYESLFERIDNGNVYKRVGDSNYGPLSHDEIANLRYDKNLRSFEDQVVDDFDSSDLDAPTLEEYRRKINFDGTHDELLVIEILRKSNTIIVLSSIKIQQCYYSLETLISI
jgi:ATP-dependent DNA helicase RecG